MCERKKMLSCLPVEKAMQKSIFFYEETGKTSNYLTTMEI